MAGFNRLTKDSTGKLKIKPWRKPARGFFTKKIKGGVEELSLMSIESV